MKSTFWTAALALLPARSAPSPAVTATAAPVVDLARVSTVPGILDRYRPSGTTGAILIDDRMLVETLREIDRPAGVIRIGGRTLLTAAVVDEDPNG